MNLTWSSVLTELVITHRVSMAAAGIWAVARWVRGVGSDQRPSGRAEWWLIPPLLWALESVQQSSLMWEASVWKPASLVAFSALINAATVSGLLIVLVLIAVGLTAPPRLQIRPLGIVGVLAAVASALFVRVLLLWAGTISLAARIEEIP